MVRADQLLAVCPPHLSGWEWHYVKHLRHGNLPPSVSTLVRFTTWPLARRPYLSSQARGSLGEW
jgi:hypothetical protein